MGSSFYSVGAKALPEDWSVNNRFYHAPSESHFEMLRRGESLVVRRYQLDKDGRQVQFLRTSSDSRYGLWSSSAKLSASN